MRTGELAWRIHLRQETLRQRAYGTSIAMAQGEGLVVVAAGNDSLVGAGDRILLFLF
jgi:hypothetical protein